MVIHSYRKTQRRDFFHAFFSLFTSWVVALSFLDSYSVQCSLLISFSSLHCSFFSLHRKMHFLFPNLTLSLYVNKRCKYPIVRIPSYSSTQWSSITCTWLFVDLDVRLQNICFHPSCRSISPAHDANILDPCANSSHIAQFTNTLAKKNT